jgi:hypothetical protein
MRDVLTIDGSYPELIVAVETIDHRASLSLWTRDQRQRMPFLKLA